MAVNKVIGAGNLINALGETHNTLMSQWQIMEPGPNADTVYSLAHMLSELIDNIEAEVIDNFELDRLAVHEGA